MSPSSLPSFKANKPNQIAMPGVARESYTVLATASSVRIYHVQFGSEKWSYSRLKGTLIFGKNYDDSAPTSPQSPQYSQATSLDVGKYWFKLLDAASGSPKPVWAFNLPAVGFIYELDRPFFHAFQGMSRKFGFLFEDDDEANTFYTKVIDETTPRPGTPKSRSRSFNLRAKTPPASLSRRPPPRPPVSASMVSLPTANSFIHVSHVGLTRSGTIEASKGVDPSWTAVLSGYGVQNTFPGHSPKVAEFSGKDGLWISGFGGIIRPDRKANKSLGASTTTGGVSPKPSLKRKRRLPTPSFSMF